MRSFENGTLTMDGDPILGMPPLNKMRYSTVQYIILQYSTPSIAVNSMSYLAVN